MNKIKNLFNNSISQTNIINTQEKIYKTNANLLKKIDNVYNYFQKSQINETDWEPLVQSPNENFLEIPSEITQKNFIKTWQINLGTLPENWIPHINIKIIYRYPDGSINLSGYPYYFYNGFIIEYNSLDKTWMAVGYIFIGQPPENETYSDIEAKLLICLTNPSCYS